MISAGLLTIRAQWSASDGLSGLDVRLQRPPVTPLFIGQPASAVVKSLPLIYTLCAEAQRFAGQAALAMAAGETPEPTHSARLWIEMLHENFWRLLLDWPPALGLAPEKAAFIAWRATRHGDNCLDETDKLLNTKLVKLAEKCHEKWVDRSTAQTPANDRDSAPDAAFCFAPTQWLAYFQGSGSLPVLTPPASMQSAFAARLAAVRFAAAGLQAETPYPLALAADNGCAVAQTITARGMLTHAVRLVAGQVAQYRVWAPTDLFFADAQALSGLLAGAEFASAAAAQQAIAQAVLALDPCLPYTVELTHA